MHAWALMSKHTCTQTSHARTRNDARAKEMPWRSPTKDTMYNDNSVVFPYDLVVISSLLFFFLYVSFSIFSAVSESFSFFCISLSLAVSLFLPKFRTISSLT
jgi:hypothetical protein